jgi:hypothetical protein
MKQRRRHPLDVPTPVAVALADFCRRADAVTDPRSVRDALSLLDAGQDPLVLLIAGAAPGAKPLGPFAVIDIVLEGMTPQDAARRQREGRYDLVSFIEVPEAPPAPPPSPKRAPEASPEKPAAKRRRKKAEAKAALTERIAPKKRAPRGEAPVAPPPPPRESPAVSLWLKRDLPRGRGRFANVETTKARAAKLLEPQKREELEALIAQHGHRVAVQQALAAQYMGRKGEPLSLAEVETAIAKHGLRPTLEAKERELLVTAVTEAKGSFFRAAAALGMKPEELDHVALNSGAQLELARIREHHAREALAHGNVRLKLDLLERGKYLADLGVERRFREALTIELKELLDALLPGPADVKELATAAARAHGLDAEKLRRAMDRTGLSAQYAVQLSSP